MQLLGIGLFNYPDFRPCHPWILFPVQMLRAAVFHFFVFIKAGLGHARSCSGAWQQWFTKCVTDSEMRKWPLALWHLNKFALFREFTYRTRYRWSCGIRRHRNVWHRFFPFTFGPECPLFSGEKQMNYLPIYLFAPKHSGPYRIFLAWKMNRQETSGIYVQSSV